MRPLDDATPGDLVALDCSGEGHHLLVIGVSSSVHVQKIATIPGRCSITFPGFAAGQREQSKFDADSRAPSQPVSSS